MASGQGRDDGKKRIVREHTKVKGEFIIRTDTAFHYISEQCFSMYRNRVSSICETTRLNDE